MHVYIYACVCMHIRCLPLNQSISFSSLCCTVLWCCVVVGGKVGSKATLGDMSGLRAGFLPPVSMIDNSAYDPDKAYKDSKLCNVMTSFELARRLQQSKSSVTCNVLNPGLIPTTGLFRTINPIFVFIFTILTRSALATT
jgi:protochlorophyllide reductase